MERHLGLVSSGKTGVHEECVVVFGPVLFDFPSTPFNCHFLDREMDGQWVKSDRSSVSTASHHPLTHFWTKLTHFWTKLTHSGPNSVPALQAARTDQPAVAEMPTHSFVQPATRLKP